MKKLLILFLLLPFLSLGQTVKKVSDLPEATTISSTDDFVIVQSGTTKKMPYSVFKWYSDDVADQVSDSLGYYASLDTLSHYPLVSGTQYQIPYLNLAGTGFDLSSNFKWNDTTLSISQGTDNVFVGINAGYSIISGADNCFLGESSGFDITIGGFNVLLGNTSGTNITSGTSNVFSGHSSGYTLTTGQQNVFVGRKAGYVNNGSNNIFLGYQSGYNETGSNKLYIENSNSATPLIYGDFSTDELTFNADTVHNKGYLNVDSVAHVNILKQNRVYHLFGGFQDSATLIDLTEDVYSHVTNAYGTLWNGLKVDGFVMSGDTSEFLYAGDYFGSYSVTFTGTAGIVYEFRVYNVTQGTQQGFAVAETGDGASDYTTVTKPLYFKDIQAGDKLVLQVTNLDSSVDITIRYGTYFITYLHE